MIKDQMTLPLGTDTTNIKSTTAVFLSATDEQVSPYTIGFVPWDLMSKCVLFGKCSRILYNSIPNTFFSSFVNPDSFYFNPDRGVPFVYTIRTGYDNKIMHANYASNSWHTDQMVGESSNTNLQILHAYNTDYFVQNNIEQNANLTNIYFDIKIYEVIGEGGWTGYFQSVYEHPYANIAASITDIENIGISFTKQIASHFGTYTYTITQDNWLNCDENGIFVIEGDDYNYQGQTYKRRLYCACVHAYVASELATTGTTPGYGVLIAPGYRSTPHASSVSWACGWGKCEYGQTSDQGYKVNPYNYQRQFPDQYGYDSYIGDGVYFFRQASIQWFNHLLHGGATYEDVVVMICTSRPVLKINNAYYVAEFTDDYYITGKLIPYAQAREWQKNINGDSNVFDPADIPEPGPEPGAEGDGDGDNIRPPAISGIGDLAGFVTMYALKPSQLAKLGQYLWSSFTSADFWNSISVVLDNTLSVDPSVILNYVVSVRAYPVDLSAFGSSELPEIFFGRGLVGVPVDSISARIYQIKDCVKLLPGGSLDVPTYYNDFRDMEPCCKAVLHVPFCGSCEINPSQIIGKHLQIYYSIDFCTGALMALCQVSGDGLPMEYTIARLYGQLGATVQLSASNELEALQCIAGASMGVASGLMGNVSGMLSGAIGVATSLANNRALPHTTGKSSGFSGFYEPRVPYIELLYDQYYIPENYAHTHGLACNVKKSISDLHGFTVCENVDTTGLTCEADERVMIKKILESGFFVD